MKVMTSQPIDPYRGRPREANLKSFQDPDGNGWLVQEITTRLPSR